MIFYIYLISVFPIFDICVLSLLFFLATGRVLYTCWVYFPVDVVRVDLASRRLDAWIRLVAATLRSYLRRSLVQKRGSRVAKTMAFRIGKNSAFGDGILRYDMGIYVRISIDLCVGTVGGSDGAVLMRSGFSDCSSPDPSGNPRFSPFFLFSFSLPIMMMAAMQSDTSRSLLSFCFFFLCVSISSGWLSSPSPPAWTALPKRACQSNVQRHRRRLCPPIASIFLCLCNIYHQHIATCLGLHCIVLFPLLIHQPVFYTLKMKAMS